MKVLFSWLFCLEEFLDQTLYSHAASIEFWDRYAQWYKLWIEHNNYHDKIITMLSSMVKPGWRVLDIGAGNGVLSLPLCVMGCDVTALEPSTGIRHLLHEEVIKRGIDWFNVEEKKWEDIEPGYLKGYDLIMASNSLHLTKTGFHESLQKIFENRPKHVLLITELCPEIKVKDTYGEYTLLFAQGYQTESSFAYQQMDEVFEHWSFSKGRMPDQYERCAISADLIFEDDHIWRKGRATVGMFWWTRNQIRKKTTSSIEIPLEHANPPEDLGAGRYSAPIL